MDENEKRERRRQGIERAKLKGKYKGRRPALTPADLKVVVRRVKNGESKYKIAADLGISRRTVYNCAKAYSNTPKFKAAIKAQIAEAKRTGKRAKKRRKTWFKWTRGPDRPFTEERKMAWIDSLIRRGEPIEREWFENGKWPDPWTLKELKQKKLWGDYIEAVYWWERGGKKGKRPVPPEGPL